MKTEKRKKMDSVCRVCRKQEETLYQIIGSSPVLAPTLYLKRCHNQVAKIISQEKMKNEKLINPPDVMKTAEAEMWWDQIMKTVARIEHNRPDMVFWDTKNKCCELIEISVPLDNNVTHAHQLKQEQYIELISQMQRLYRGYKYSVIVITVGCLGTVSDKLTENLLALGIDEDKIATTIHRIQRASLL